MKAIDNIRKLLKDTATVPNWDVIDALGEIGNRTIHRAADSKNTRDITGNQLEAFGWAVFFNKQRMKQGYLDEDAYNMEPEADKRGKRGRMEAMHDIQSFVPEQDGYALYLVNSMWYSMILEDWGYAILTQELIKAANQVSSAFNVNVDIRYYWHPYLENETHYKYG